jgi:alpha-L-rhamnosidase
MKHTYNKYIVVVLCSAIILCISSADAQVVKYPPITAKRSGPANPLSPDPLVNYSWSSPKADDDLQSYPLRPVSCNVDNAANFDMSRFKKDNVITVKGKGEIRFDFGQTNAGWLEFESDDLVDSVTLSISEYNEPAIVNNGAVHRFKTLAPVKYGHTYRLELNPQLYEGVRFGWIHVLTHHGIWHIKNFRVQCQIKPTNYMGSFACSDPELTRIWYTGAYTVKLNILKDYLGAILIERQDRFSWTGDAYVAQAASMVAFGNYDFVKKNINYTSTQDNGIASYALYWVLSLIDYVNYTGDVDFARKYLANATGKLDKAYQNFGKSPRLEFYGWDERLGAGFENANNPESQRAYSMLSIRTWLEYGKLMKQLGNNDLAKKYIGYANEKIAEERSKNNWQTDFALHSAADAINTGLLTPNESATFFSANFTDRVNRISYSPFNEYFIVGALAKMRKYDDAISAVKDCWGGQIKYGGTTFFEVYRPSWNAITGKNGAVPNNQCTYTSLTHPWSAGVTKWLSEEILGIKPLEPGFKTFEIVPHLADTMTVVKGSTPTGSGTVTAGFDLKTGRSTVIIPEGSVAKRVAIPLGTNTAKTLYLDGKLIWNGKLVNRTFHNKIEVKDGYLNIADLSAGKYDFKVIYSAAYHKQRPKAELPWQYVINDFKQDSLTSGKWTGHYGREGYVLLNQTEKGKNVQKLPPYLSAVSLRNEANVHSDLPADSRVLTDATGAAAGFGAAITQDPIPLLETMTVDITAKDNQSHQIAIYFLDWNKESRRSAIEIFDAKTLKLLAPVQMVKSYQNGRYLIFNYTGSIRLRIDQVRGTNVAISGLFFDSPK